MSSDYYYSSKGDLCLVTGITGYIGSHLAKVLADDGFRVRGTVRSLTNNETLDFMRNLVPGVELVAANLRESKGWAEAVAGATWVFHVASPMPDKFGANCEQGAVEGLRFVLEACIASGGCVKRVLVTSSEAAISYGHPSSKVRFTEDDWSVPSQVSAYFRSKTLEEKLAWEMEPQLNARGIELVTINPALALGPSLVPWARFSLKLVRDVAQGKLPALPRMVLHLVDVRDVARMQATLMAAPDAAGRRHVCGSADCWFSDLAKAVRERYSAQGFNPSTWETPTFLLTLVSGLSSELASVRPKLGKEVFYETKYPGAYNYAYTDVRQMVWDTVECLLAQGHMKPKKRLLW